MSYDSWKLATPPEYEEMGDAEQPDNREIKTERDPKPIPIRGFDWEAWFADDDMDEDLLVGYGATEAEAIADLIERGEDR